MTAPFAGGRVAEGSQGTPHARREDRPIPAGPTVLGVSQLATGLGGAQFSNPQGQGEQRRRAMSVRVTAVGRRHG